MGVRVVVLGFGAVRVLGRFGFGLGLPEDYSGFRLFLVLSL